MQIILAFLLLMACRTSAEENLTTPWLRSEYYKIADEGSLLVKQKSQNADLVYRIHFCPATRATSSTPDQIPPYFITIFFKFDEDMQVDTATGSMEIKILLNDGKIIKRYKNLTGNEGTNLIQMFHEEEIFVLPPKQDMSLENMNEGVALDLGYVVLERAKGHEYRVIYRWWPVSGPVARAINFVKILGKINPDER